MNIIIDNYDSFTYNLVQYVGEIDSEIRVYKNDKIDVEKITSIAPDHIIISPGPGRPENSGVSIDVIEKLKGKFPILGVCLGHQVIGHVFGASIVTSENIMHGKTSHINHNGQDIFRGIPSPLEATRYHSLIIDENSLPKELEIIAKTSEGLIMGIKHREYCMYGLQFHPESVLTTAGFSLIENFLNEN